MAKRLLIIIALSALCVSVIYPEDKAEQLNSRLKELIKQLGNDDWQVRENAHKALEEIGEPAEEALTEATKSTDPEIRHRASIILRPLLVKKRVKFSDGLLKDFPNIYNEISTADTNIKFQLLKKVAATTGRGYKYKITTQDVANLIGEVLSDGEKGLNATQKGFIILTVNQPNPIPEAAPYIIKFLNDATSGIRNQALEALGNLDARQAIPEIRKFLSDTNKGIAATAIITLGKLGDKESISVIIPLLSDEEICVRAAAAQALGMLGVKEAIPQLITSLKDKNSNVRMSAAKSLSDLEAKESIPELMKRLKDADYAEKNTIEIAIAGLITKETLPQIIKLAKEANITKNIAVPLGQGLSRLGAEKALPELIPLLKDEDKDIRWSANKALGKVISLKVIPDLLTLLKHENGEVRGFAALLLVDLFEKDKVPKELIEDIKLIEKWGGSYESRARAALSQLGESK